MKFHCWMVFVDDSEVPVYIWDDDALYAFCERLVMQRRTVEIFGVFR